MAENKIKKIGLPKEVLMAAWAIALELSLLCLTPRW